MNALLWLIALRQERQFDLVTGTAATLLFLAVLVALFVFIMFFIEADKAKRERDWAEDAFVWNVFASVLEKMLNNPSHAAIVIAFGVIAFAVYHFFF